MSNERESARFTRLNQIERDFVVIFSANDFRCAVSLVITMNRANGIR